MKSELNPVIAVVVIALVVVGLGILFWSKGQGTTFTKAEAHGKLGERLDALTGAQPGAGSR